MGEDQNAIANIFKDHKKALSVLSSIAAFVGMILFLLWFFKGKPKESVTAERKYEKFGDFAERKDDGTYQLKQARKSALNTKIKRMRTAAEQYVLVAKTDGNYQCLHCPQGVFYLHKNEVAKIGTTIQGEEGRYDQNYYNRMNLQYIVEYTGNLQEAKERELIRIGNYPLTQENLARPDDPLGGMARYKLARPPLNTGDF